MPTTLSSVSFHGCRLYGILDPCVLGSRDPVAVAESAIRGGVDAIQWRDKDSSDRAFLEVAVRLRALTRRLSAIFVVNNRVSVAQLAQADGVHLGHEDLPIAQARRLVGNSMLIGRSTHSAEEAVKAQEDGADYLGVGPVFSTPTKPFSAPVGLELIRQVRSLLTIPWVAIGGIDPERLPLVLSAGATRVAVVRAIAGDPDPESAAKKLKALLKA